MKYKYSLLAAAVVVGSLASGAAVYAFENDTENEDSVAIDNAKISLVQAISAAEQHVGGKAAKGEYELDKGQWVYDIEVIRDQKVTDVKVDPATGKVLSAEEDKPDADDERDHDK